MPRPPAVRLDAPFPIFRADCRDLLPPGWDREIRQHAAAYAEYSCLTGDSPTSRQRQFGSFAEYVVGVVTGKVVHNELPWLAELYHSDVLDLGNGLGLGEFVASADERSSVNLNVLQPGQGYEWHVDSNPLTGLLFVTDQPGEGGGELVFRADPVTHPGEDWELVVRPRAGELLIFDARQAAHAVLPVLGTADRISVPMNFYHANAANVRPDCLDRYLYGE